MRIDSSQVQMQASHNQESRETSDFSLRYWDNNSSFQLSSKQDEVHISLEGRNLLQGNPALNLTHDQSQTQSPVTNSKEASSEEEDVLPEASERDKQKLFLVKRLLRSLEGTDGRNIKPDQLDCATPRVKKSNISTVNVQDSKPAIQTQTSGVGMELEIHQSRTETEQTAFSAQAVVKTKDGRTFAVNVTTVMSRSFTSEVNLEVRAGEATKDPLVINYTATAASLTDAKYDFDIDADGTADQVSMAGPGSGFLAIDRNVDGLINNGNELFGAKTGNGFQELAAFDADSNGWIDESDPIFDKLLVWSKGADGSDNYTDLRSLGIGAIYLGNTATPFELKDAANNTEGLVRTSGIYLRENGEAGTVQQIDLTV